jgi:ABC-type transport system substrate-binding protein
MTESQRSPLAPAPLALDRRSFVALLAGAGAAAGIGPAQAQKRGGILRVAAPANPSTLDPTTGRSGQDHSFLYTIFDSLVEFDYGTLQPKPGLAESWKFTDPQTLVLKIRSGVTFHDGTPLDAEAVRFNLERNRTDPRSNVKSDLATVESITVTGPQEVTLKLKQPDTALILILSDRAGMMSSPKAVKELDKEHDRKPIGTGPWKLVVWNDNEKVVVTRNEKYWKPGKPYLDGIEMAIIPEINTGLRSVIAGQNDFVYFLSPQQKTVIDRAKNLTAVTGPTLYCVQFYINYGKAPFNDLRVRQALNFAIDRETFAKQTMGGLSETAYGLLPSTHWAHDKSLASIYPYNPEKAKSLLAEAGHKDGLDILILGYSDQRSQQRQEVLIEQLKKAGFRAKVQVGSIPEMTEKFFAEKVGDIYLSAWTGRPDPSLTFQLMFGAQSYYNAGRVEGAPGLTDAILATRVSEDIEARKAAFLKLQRLVAENALHAPLLFQYEFDAHTEKVKGYKPNLLGKPKYEDIYLEG